MIDTDTGQKIKLPPVICEDTRQQPGKHGNVKAFCDLVGIRIVRTKLTVGDYTLPTNQSICVDTKYGLQEVYGNLVQDHERFRRECVLAQELGIRLVVLVEQGEIRRLDEVHLWQNPRYERYMFLKDAHKRGRFMGTKLPPKAPLDSGRLQTMMETMADKYGIEWRFCCKSETGLRICEILMGGADEL